MLDALLRAFWRGIYSIDLGAASAALYLEKAREKWLDEHAGLYAFVRGPLETDAQLATRVPRDAFNRMGTTETAVLAALGTLGLTARVERSDKLVYRFDTWDDLNHLHGLDLSSLSDTGVEMFDDIPDFHQGSAALYPEGEGVGLGGFVLYIQSPYSAALEAQIHKALRDHVKAMGDYVLGWAFDFSESVEDSLESFEEGFVGQGGWGLDEWGDSTWG